MTRIFDIFFSYNSKLTRIRKLVDDLARTDISVLIKGESGTGKGLIAQTIHFLSPRRTKPFIKVNCAAIPRDLLESELFGFEKGAFTGVHMKKPGKFELADEGTILLNEIGEMDISLQAKLLQVLQEGEFSRLGGNGNVSVNTRVIITTKDHLEELMRRGLFREDLFYRINVVTITVPPLRDRREQIVPFSQYFFNLYRTRYGKNLPPLSLRTLGAFKKYDWPGNIRELENVIKRLVLLGEEAVVENMARSRADEAPGSKIPGLVPVGDLETRGSLNLRRVGKEAGETAEKRLIHETLQQTCWNRKDAAKLLGISYKTLLNKIQKYRLAERGQLQGGRGIA